MDLKTIATLITMLQGASWSVQFMIIFILVVVLLGILAKTGLIKLIVGRFKNKKEDVNIRIDEIDKKLDTIIEELYNFHREYVDKSKCASDNNSIRDRTIQDVQKDVNSVIILVEDLKAELKNKDRLDEISHKLDTINDSTGRGY